jgi:hypothetical protein
MDVDQGRTWMMNNTSVCRSHLTPDNLALLASALLICGNAWATPPTIYSQAAYESPVRGDPDGLVLLPGYGFTATDRVVYAAVQNTTLAISPPAIDTVPVTPTASVGFADVASTADVPHTLTAHLPSVVSQGSTYAIWVVDANGEWSNSVLINDARPLWVTPDYAYATANVANLPRILKVNGRNLQPTPQGTTQVQLVGPATYTLTAASVDASLSRYSAQVTLPSPMAVGTYSVQVSRDGTSWVPLLGENGNSPQTLTVQPDPAPLTNKNSISVDTYSTCDSTDDTTCIVAAIQAAGDTTTFPQGATVVFSARTYRLFDPGTWPSTSNSSSKSVDFEGIWVPQGVSLLGAGMGSTIIDRGTGWVTARFAPAGQTIPIYSLFNLQGRNVVQGFTFSDENVYTPATPGGINTALELGIDYNYARNIPLANPVVSHVIITQNEFKIPFTGIQSLGLPIDHLFITNNVLAGYWNGLYLSQQFSNWLTNPYHLTDSVIASNTFDPTSYPQTIASQISGGTRLDFSNNTADGTATTYLYSPSDPKGFIAAFFWNLSDNGETNLISQNVANCSGDKGPNGEAIVFDGGNLGNYGGFTQAVQVASATSNASTASTITVNATPLTAALGYNGQWVQVVGGPGVGQVRKITSSNIGGSSSTFTVEPAFDVLPQPGSLLTVGLENWQTYIVSNTVDHSSPLCQNPYRAFAAANAGTISFFTQTADSVIEGNQQTATTGILLYEGYWWSGSGTAAGLSMHSSNEIRNNFIFGPPDFGGTIGRAGLRTAYLTDPGGPNTTLPSLPPPVVNFGQVIAGNELVQVPEEGGAIEFWDADWVGPQNSQGGCSSSWKLVEAPVIFQNTLSDSPLGIGINVLAQPHGLPGGCSPSVRETVVWHSVLYENSCQSVTQPLIDNGTASQRVCPAATGGTCECATYIQGSSGAPAATQSSVAVSYSNAQTAGDLNVVVVGWSNPAAAVSSVTDTAGNSYTLAVNTSGAAGVQSIYYAGNIAAASNNQVTLAFTAAPGTGDIRIAEYSGLNVTTPLDPGAVSGLTGSGSLASAGWVTTTNPNDLLISGDYAASATVGPGSRYTERFLTSPLDNILQDRTVRTTAAYSATAPLASSAAWVAQVAAFQLAGGGDLPSAQDLTAPSNLSATVVSNAQINLSWSASSDDFRVTGYIIERCSGAACSNYAPVGTASSTSYSDSTAAASSSYGYRVRATDIANLRSTYSVPVVVATGP